MNIFVNLNSINIVFTEDNENKIFSFENVLTILQHTNKNDYYYCTYRDIFINLRDGVFYFVGL